MKLRWKILIGVVLLLVVAAGVAAKITVPYYAITPGNSINVANFIELPQDKVHHHPGSVYMTDVLLTPLTAFDYPYFKFLNSQATVLPNSQVIGFLPVSEYNTEGSIDMADASQAAQYVALHELGYNVGAELRGFQLYAIDPAAPAYSVISVGEVMTAVNGHKLQNSNDITGQIINHKPGSTVTVNVRPYSNPIHGKPQTITAALGEYRVQNGNDRCYAVGTGTKYPLLKVKGAPSPYPCLGVEIYAYYKLTNLPFKISIDPGDIVGPSAGLAFTLGLMNQLDPVSLTGGRHIAATGTMSLDGSVGPVGGLPQKTIAVQNAGATVFFVPAGGNYHAALTKASKNLTVVPVRSLQDALKWLLGHGGKIVTPSGKVIR
jgi:PDZ domain-containing protein